MNGEPEAYERRLRIRLLVLSIAVAALGACKRKEPYRPDAAIMVGATRSPIIWQSPP
jgi:hypothetical protein